MRRLAELSDAASETDLTRILGALCAEAGFEHFMVLRLLGIALIDVIQLMHNAPAAAQQDATALATWWPLVSVMRTARPPQIFGTGARPAPKCEGYSHGIAAIDREQRNACVVYFARRRELDKRDEFEQQGIVQVVAMSALQALKRLHNAACPLSERELTCLTYFLSGSSAKQAARAMNISPRTFEQYLARARHRLDSKNSMAAGIYAVEQGWISLASIRALSAA